MELGMRLGLGEHGVPASAIVIPSGALAVLEFSSGSGGSWSNITNTGSLGGTWQRRTGSTIVCRTGGPNSLKYGENSGSDDAIILHDGVDAAKWDEIFTATAGMIGLVGRMPIDSAPATIEFDDTLLNGGSSAGAVTFGETNSGGSFWRVKAEESDGTKRHANHAATANAWHALVVRWNANTFYSKRNGESSWTETTLAGGAGLRNLAANFYLIGNGGGWANVNTDCAYAALYASGTASTADQLLAFLTAAAGL